MEPDKIVLLQHLLADLQWVSTEEMSQAFLMLEQPEHPQLMSDNLEKLTPENWVGIQLLLTHLQIHLQHSRVH